MIKKNLTLLTLIHSFQRFATNSLGFFWAIYFTQIGLSGTQSGILFMTLTVTGVLITLPGGLLNDRIPSKRIIQLGLILMIIEFLTLSQTQYFPFILAMFFIGGIGTNLYNISMDSLFYKTSQGEPPSKRIKTYVGFYLLGAGIGVLFSGNILEYIDFQKYLIVTAGLVSILLILSLLLPSTETFKFEIESYKKDIKKPHVLLFIAIIFSFAIHMGSEFTSYGPFLKETLGLTFSQMGAYMGTAIICMFATVRLTNRALEKGTGIKTIITLGLLCSGIGYLIMLIPIIPISLVGRIIHEGGDAMMFVFLYTGVLEFFKKERIGGNSGLITLTQTSAIALSSLVFGPLGSSFGNQIPIIIGAITTLLAIILLKEYEHISEKHSNNGNAR
ncbi:MAG: major facilitator superfamily protein [Candidatus Peregrinibacteria bacterium GW2011_GWF2_43_17]|nr:MAG: major facilitator superfamily protein [Candidatus Peregrinibacteria bacterium GW2011_GWF2_43_17]KKT20339.1 MAG: Major facilitator superfamily [Candidatus Peregrinibacteria bacterium GW2011_GWA2_43_8]HAU39406.1 hypothetical protein [Candidatus Peregrinibacteria bacterium]